MPGAAASSASIKPMQRRAVALDRRLERHVAARAEDRGAMIAETPLTSTTSPGARQMRAKIHGRPRITPIPVVVRNSLSHAPRCTTLVSPVTIWTPALRGRRAIELRDPAQQVDVDALLDDHRAGQIQRHGAADREIVDRAADRERADVAAGKEQRIDDERIGGERQPIAAAASAQIASAPDLPARASAALSNARRTRRRSGPSSPCRRRRARA